MRRALILTALALLPFAAAAQTAATGQLSAPEATAPAPVHVHLGLTDQPSCPVGFNAQLSPNPGTVIVDSGTHAPVSQQVQLSFQNPGGLGIIAMRLVVHGLTPQPQATPVVATGSAASGMIDTPATLRLAVGPGAVTSTQLGVKGITSIRSIDLVQVTYVGGTLWEATPGHPCNIEPNRVMLVATH